MLDEWRYTYKTVFQCQISSLAWQLQSWSGHIFIWWCMNTHQANGDPAYIFIVKHNILWEIQLLLEICLIIKLYDIWHNSKFINFSNINCTKSKIPFSKYIFVYIHILIFKYIMQTFNMIWQIWKLARDVKFSHSKRLYQINNIHCYMSAFFNFLYRSKILKKLSCTLNHCDPIWWDVTYN